MSKTDPVAAPMSSSLEDYLESIYLLEQEQGAARVKDIARSRGVRAATVSVALGKLAEAGLVDYKRREHLRLTPEGEETARRILTRHRLLARFFEEVLEMPPDAAGEQACAMEHSLTDEAMDRMVSFFEFLGNCPSVVDALRSCPLRARAAGKAASKADPGATCARCSSRRRAKTLSLADLKAGQRAVVKRILATGAARRRLLDRGVLPEVVIEVERTGARGGSVWVQCQGASLDLRMSEAAAIRVREAPAAPGPHAPARRSADHGALG